MTRELAVLIYSNAYLVPWPQAVLLSALWAVLFIRMANDAARRHGVVALPGPRASHTEPTPRLGGLGIAAAIFTVTLMLEFMRPFAAGVWAYGTLIGAAYALVGGLLDDVADLPPPVKFLFQAAAAGTAIAAGVTVAPTTLPGGITVGGGLTGAAIAFAIIVFMMNAYNFMDGMDGQAATFGVVVASGLLASVAGLYVRWFAVEALLLAAIIGSLAAFFIFNRPGRPPGQKTFMGDSGSQFIGFLLGALIVRLSAHGGVRVPLVASAILVLPFAWDVIYTIIRRLARGENVVKPHRSHLYQRLLVAGWSHGQTLALNASVYVCYMFLALAYAAIPTDPRADFWTGDMRIVVVATALGGMAAYTLVVLLVERNARAQA